MNNEEIELASFMQRVGALLIDWIILVLIIVPLMFTFYTTSDIVQNQNIAIGPIDFIISYILPFVYTVVFWMYKSATPGKMALNIEVVDAQTLSNISIKQALARYAGYFVSSIVFMLGFLWPLWDKKNQAWHDKIGKTVVIKKKRETITPSK